MIDITLTSTTLEWSPIIPDILIYSDIVCDNSNSDNCVSDKHCSDKVSVNPSSDTHDMNMCTLAWFDNPGCIICDWHVWCWHGLQFRYGSYNVQKVAQTSASSGYQLSWLRTTYLSHLACDIIWFQWCAQVEQVWVIIHAVRMCMLASSHVRICVVMKHSQLYMWIWVTVYVEVGGNICDKDLRLVASRLYQMCVTQLGPVMCTHAITPALNKLDRCKICWNINNVWYSLQLISTNYSSIGSILASTQYILYIFNLLYVI